MIDKHNIKYNKIILIGITNNNINKQKCILYLKELELLVKTLNGKIYKKFIQKILFPKKTLIGKGKIQEIIFFIKKNKIDTVIFNHELKPTQLKNIKILLNGTNIIDRTQVILDIFLKRAKTFYSKTQIILAQYKYILPRLKGMWSHLERQKGGIGIRSGAGESELETDKRFIKKRIKNLKKKILKINKQLNTQRKNRKNFKNISIIGYTNVGKSTIMNKLTQSNIVTENRLFVTVDTTVRKLIIKKKYILINDTVGFIHNLPNQLIESFQSTVNEIKDADLLLHIVDITFDDYFYQMIEVNKILNQINVQNKPCIIILNKYDLYKNKNKNKIISKFKKFLETENIYYDKKYILKYITLSSINTKDILFLKKLIYKYI